MTVRPGARPRPARRFDPDRRDRLIDATIDALAEHGVAGTTHRVIAAAADVPLGSVTYHFASLDELRTLAFTRHAEAMSVLFAAHFDAVATRADLVEAVVDLVHGGTGDHHDALVSFELYLAALRNPELRAVTEVWMRTSRAVLERFVDPDTARGLDALTEGLTIHDLLGTAPRPREVTRAAVVRALTPTVPPTPIPDPPPSGPDEKSS